MPRCCTGWKKSCWRSANFTHCQNNKWDSRCRFLNGILLLLSVQQVLNWKIIVTFNPEIWVPQKTMQISWNSIDLSQFRNCSKIPCSSSKSTDNSQLILFTCVALIFHWWSLVVKKSNTFPALIRIEEHFCHTVEFVPVEFVPRKQIFVPSGVDTFRDIHTWMWRTPGSLCMCYMLI